MERSRSLAEPPTGPLVVVPADRTEHWLRRDGYAPRQFWRSSDGPNQASGITGRTNISST